MMAVRNQPGIYAPSDFQTGVLDCGSDLKVCLFGCFCQPCLGCSIASDMNECFLCGTHMAIRSVYRTRYNISGSLCGDFVAMLCCRPCTLCQLKRDINCRKEQGIF
ncbi:placenta-specific gene 8 protein-like [Amphiprion ocellaris]|uniref:Placenta associated 8, tandem duplicate 1 n=1 Tax=Amphiprion ocellaris TaxID=80972 RepID=A0A3Q1B8K8_AMPOC|nr:placenta-specific gene 8 protein-like [Amphiprion ocellaris]